MQETIRQPTTDASSPKKPRSRSTLSLVAVVVVAIGSFVSYQALIPQTHVVPSELARLVVSRPGVKAFDIKATSALVQPVAKSGIKPLQAAAKQFPAETGIYSKVWRPSPTVTAATEVIAFLSPSTSTASSIYHLLRTQQLNANSNAANSLARRSTFSVSGVAGSAGAIYGSSAKPTTTAATPTLGVVVFRIGRVVALTELVNTSGTQSSVQVVARSEAAQLRAVEPGFTLAVVSYPKVASIEWGIVSLLVLLIVGYLPFGLPRWRERQALLRSLQGERGDTWSVVYKRTDSGWSAYVPALPGVEVTGVSRTETDQLLGEAIAEHLDEMRKEGLPIPERDDIEVGQIAAAALPI
ncbi:MAG: type II toxin-antitoxin system HicB family antitoxin [Ferrimicrobium sp.]